MDDRGGTYSDSVPKANGLGEDVVMRRLRAWQFSVVAVVAIATGPAAFGHGPFGPARGYVSSVTSIEPNVLGLQASVVGDRLLVRNWSPKTVIILAPDGRPYLRFGRRGVFASSGLGWTRVSGGTSYGWHDPRVRWSGRQAPEAVRRHPEQAHLLRAWRVRGSAGEKAFVIRGLLGYAPPPATKRDAGLWTWLAPVLGGTAAAGLAFLALRSRSRPTAGAGSGSGPATATRRAPGSRFRRRARSSRRS
jgi:hypothetical protein